MRVNDLIQEQTQQSPVQAAQAKLNNLKKSLQLKQQEIQNIQQNIVLAQKQLQLAQQDQQQQQVDPAIQTMPTNTTAQQDFVNEAQQLNEMRQFIRAAKLIWKYVPLSVKKKMPWGKKPDTWNPDEFIQYLEKTGNAKRDLENLIKNVSSIEQLAKMEKHLSDYIRTNPNAAPAGKYLLGFLRSRMKELTDMNNAFIRPDVDPADWRIM